VLARESGRCGLAAIRPHFRALNSVDDKGADTGAYDPVTEADRDAEVAIRDLIAHASALHMVCSARNFRETPGSTGWRWVLDPVDGTRAFVAGLPVWTTLIALSIQTVSPQIGIIDQPVLGERYLGWPGGAVLETPDGA
jgi:fructose-1,6-bisphosphatase/inositol monophosphatase family enzyme